jgi:hypothetical protein
MQDVNQKKDINKRITALRDLAKFGTDAKGALPAVRKILARYDVRLEKLKIDGDGFDYARPTSDFAYFKQLVKTLRALGWKASEGVPDLLKLLQNAPRMARTRAETPTNPKREGSSEDVRRVREWDVRNVVRAGAGRRQGGRSQGQKGLQGVHPGG